MFIKKIFSSLPSNLLLSLSLLLVLMPIITIDYVIKFYLFTVKFSINRLKQGIVVRFYRYLTTKNPHHHVAIL
ncbi:MAG: hypothetical protein Q8807_02830 ['Waltheria sp.' little leaf phytoplasma]|nr:hypothetical protein ['Waltheria sp.' little leaf phytoplasma]MDV3166575.1 hypothetical protein ['Waltheria sp.' little leaf phytoplasma]